MKNQCSSCALFSEDYDKGIHKNVPEIKNHVCAGYMYKFPDDFKTIPPEIWTDKKKCKKYLPMQN